MVENGALQGVVFESKSGRQAVLGKVVIDASGDGDILASAGAEFDCNWDGEVRSSQLALVFRVGNVDFARYNEFRQSNPEKHAELIREAEKTWPADIRSALTPTGGGHRMPPFATPHEDVIWVNNWIRGVSAINVEDLTWVEVNMRKAMLPWHDFYRKNMPGFEKSFILDTASQLGTRGSRRLVGEYTVTKENAGTVHDDTTILFRRVGPAADRTRAHFPYRRLCQRQ